jgi:hypothetical protein
MKSASNYHNLLFASEAICKTDRKVFRNSSVKNRLITHSRKSSRYGKYLTNQMKTIDRAYSQPIRRLNTDTSFYVISN